MSNFLKNIPEPSKFKNANGVLLTKGLFFETCVDNSKAIYTLKDDDHSFGDYSYLSLYKLYMLTEDPTEYLFAQEYLDSWQHWETLQKSPWFKPYLVRFRTELDLKLRAQALQRIKTEAKTNSKNSFTANRFLLEKGWITKESTRGRPSKEEIKRTEMRLLEDNTFLDEDFQRILPQKITPKDLQ